MGHQDTSVRYVCLSDLHLGGAESILTGVDIDNLPWNMRRADAPPAMKALHACVKRLLRGNSRAPTLVLAGDILEFSLANPNQAFMAFDHFLMLFGPLFGEIIFIPGNHDHHVWESVRDSQYARYVQGRHKAGATPIRPNGWFDEPWHSTYAMEPTPLPIELFDAIKERYDGTNGRPNLTRLPINCVYPNYAVFNRERCLVFSHGHYVENKYRAGSYLRQTLFEKEPPPRDIEHLEIDNFAWIEYL